MASETMLEAILGPGGLGSQAAAQPLRAFAWARVSTDAQGERGDSIAEQLRQISTYATREGIEIAAEFSEIASAYQRDHKRFEFHRMLSQARATDGINAIVVHDLSRFGRAGFETQTLVRDLAKQGIQVISVNDPAFDPESSSGVWVEAITFAKNESFSRDVAFHTRKGCRANIQSRDPKSGWCHKNGGQALLGYKSEVLIQGLDKRGREIKKSIWLINDTVVAGRTMRDWAHHCLVELAGNGASLNELRDFCEKTGLPPRRKAHWGTSTWHGLLQPHILLKYCGHEVWNVHRKNGSIRPRGEWVIIENAHEAILTPQEAERIAGARRSQTRPNHFPALSRSRNSPYLLSGGAFTCGRCGANMTGLKTAKGRHYVCGSLPYRRGRGCGPGVYVRVDQIEAETMRGLGEIVAHCSDPRRFTDLVNSEIGKLCPSEPGRDPEVQRELAAINVKIANVRRVLADGDDSGWAEQRICELEAERTKLSAAVGGDKPRIRKDLAAIARVSVEQAMAYRRDLEKLFEHGSIEDKKALLRIWIAEMKLAPERREVEITYRVPEPIMKELVAGAGFEPATFGL